MSDSTNAEFTVVPESPPQTPYPNGDVIVHNAIVDLKHILDEAKQSMSHNDFLVYCTAIGGVMSMISQDLIKKVIGMLNKETNETITVHPDHAKRILDLINEKRDAA